MFKPIKPSYIAPITLSVILIGCGGGSDDAPVAANNSSVASQTASSMQVISSAIVSSALAISSAAVSSAAAQAAPVLDDHTAVFVRETPVGDQIVAIDTSTRKTLLLQDFKSGGGAKITHVAISPDRTTIAFGAHYQLSAEDLAQGIPSEAIWTMNADGTGLKKRQTGFPAASPGFTQACSDNSICQSINAQTVCGTSGYCQLSGQTNILDDLAWSPDGREIWFTLTQMTSTTTGGSGIGWLPSSGGSSTMIAQVCQLQSDPLPVANGTIYFRASLCSGQTSDVLAFIPTKTATGATPLLSADNLGGVYAGSLGEFGIKETKEGNIIFSVSRGDFDNDSNAGYTIAEYSPDQSNVVALPDVSSVLAGFAPSPDDSKLIACFNDNPNALQYNLYLMDTAKTPLNWEALTTDGKSCEPAW